MAGQSVYSGTVDGKEYVLTMPSDASTASLMSALSKQSGIAPDSLKKRGLKVIKKNTPNGADSFLSAFAQIPLANWHDEAASAVNGRSLKREQALEQAAYSNHPALGWGGTAAGVLATILAMKGNPANAWAMAPESAAAQAGRRAALAIPGGGVAGAGASDPGHRVAGAAEGMALAPAISFLAPYLFKPITGAAEWANRRFGPRNWNADGWMAELGDRLKGIVSPDDAAANAAKARAAGVEPAPLDAIGPAGQDVVRGVAERPGSLAQPILEKETVERTLAAPGRMGEQARAAVRGTRAPPIPGRVEGQAPKPLTLREELGAKRNRQFSATVDPVRGAEVEIPDDIAEMLVAPDMRSTIAGSLKFTKDPAERKQLIDFSRWATGQHGGYSRPSGEMMEAAGLAPDEIAAIHAGGGLTPPTLSLGAADALRRSLGAAEGDSTPAFTAARQELTNFLETSIPEFGEAMRNYRGQSRIASPGKTGEVSKIGKDRGEAIALGEQLLSGDPEKMSLMREGLGEMDVPVMFKPPEGPLSVTPRQAAIEGAARSVERAAGERGGLTSVSEGMASREQQARNRVILKPEQADKLESGIAAETARVKAAGRAAPNAFQSAEAEKAGNAMLSAAGLLSTSPVIQARGGGSLLAFVQRVGISKEMADKIARGVINPQETDALIASMKKRGIKDAKANEIILGIRNLAARGVAGLNSSAQREQHEGAVAGKYGNDREYDFQAPTDANDDYEYTAPGAIAAAPAPADSPQQNITVEPQPGFATDAGDEFDYVLPDQPEE
jgi:hypothetical protein